MHRGWTNVQEKFAQACYNREHVIKKKIHTDWGLYLYQYIMTLSSKQTFLAIVCLMFFFFFPNKQTYNYYGLRKHKAPTAIIEQQ